MSWIEDPGVKIFRGLNLSKLLVDEAYINVTSYLDESIQILTLSDDCYRCPFSLLETIPGDDPPHVFPVKTDRHMQWRVQTEDNNVICNYSTVLGEFGVYDFIIDSKNSCEFQTAKEPVNIYLPMLLVILILIAISVGIKVAIFLWNYYRVRPEIPEDENILTVIPKTRVKALDTFRGISITVMIFVNSGGGHYWFLEHATWNGLHVADLVFPWFMWIMGVCIPISIRSQLARCTPRYKLFINVLRRSCILFLLGIMLNTQLGNNHFDSIRIFGVLQRFGVVYFVVGTLQILFLKGNYESPSSKIGTMTQDIIILLPQYILMAGIVALHCSLTFYLNVPDCPTGYLGPAGIQGKGLNPKCIGGATGYIDRLVLGLNHIYQHPTAKKVYGSGPFDPEGILGCLMSVVQVFLGVQAGTIIMFHKEWKDRVYRWLIWGALTGIIAGILCGFSKENGWIPVNKNLWSLSFMLVTTSFAFILLSCCYVFIDVVNIWSGSPFLYPGMNATIMYVGHSVAHSMFPWHWKIGLMNTHFVWLVEAIWGVILWILIAANLYRKKIFFSI